MRKILIIILLFIVLRNYHCILDSGRFLSSEGANDHTGKATVHNETVEEEGIELHYEVGSYGFFMCILISIFLTLFAGIMSGLTVGLLSIDTLELEMKMIHGTEEQKRLATEVLPLLNKHHYLLVTLLLWNAAAMEALPIFLDAIVPAVWAIIISVTAVLFFGEIIPQAVWTGPQQLKIASRVASSVNFLMIVVGIVAFPISKILDCLLGEHHAIRYNNNDLKALIELHSLKALQETLGGPGAMGFGLQPFQTKMIQGAIDIQNKKVKDIMIPFQRVYSLGISKKIDVKTAKKILKWGFSRIPVYIEKDRHSIIGYLLIKTLVGVDLTEGKTLEELISESVVVLRRPLYVSPNDPIGGLLTKFKNGKSHMGIVTDDADIMEGNMKRYLDEDESYIESELKEKKNEKPQVLGIITLEDVIESALKEDILDEADYDIENNANLLYNPDKSVEEIKTNENKSTNLHDRIKEIVINRLEKKGNGPGSSVEMSDMKEGLIDKNGNDIMDKKAILMMQMKHPELSKTYSVLSKFKI